MNVGQLKEIIADMADNVPILIPAPDHEYSEADASESTAIFYPKHGVWEEDHDQDLVEGGKRKNALIIS